MDAVLATQIKIMQTITAIYKELDKMKNNAKTEDQKFDIDNIKSVFERVEKSIRERE